MKTATCTHCKKPITKAIVRTPDGTMCYSCYARTANKERKRRHGNEEARMQSEFFEKFPIVFPVIPDKLLFAVPNGGSRNAIEAANLKRQGVKAGVSDVILLMPFSPFAALCLEFKTRNGKFPLDN